MKFCSICAHPVALETPEGDNRQRSVCGGCGEIHYVNPRTVVGCLVECGSRVLLCRRAIEPARGAWTLPAGFLELDEGLREGAARETREEALAEVRVGPPHAMLELFHIGQVYVLYRAQLREAEPGHAAFGVGAESLEVALFEPDEFPMGELAFPVIHFALELYRKDLALGRHRVHQGNLSWNGTGSRFDAQHYELLNHVPLELGPQAATDPALPG